MPFINLLITGGVLEKDFIACVMKRCGELDESSTSYRVCELQCVPNLQDDELNKLDPSHNWILYESALKPGKSQTIQFKIREKAQDFIFVHTLMYLSGSSLVTRSKGRLLLLSLQPSCG
jgi:hypothetical protein